MWPFCRINLKVLKIQTSFYKEHRFTKVPMLANVGTMQSAIDMEHFVRQCETRGAIAMRYFPSMWRLKVWQKKQIFFEKKSKLATNVSMENLLKESKPIVLEINEFKN